MRGIEWGSDPKKWQVGNFDWSVVGERIRDTPDRWGVVPPQHHCDSETKYFHTHAEAITYAQTEARHTCTACSRRMPYLEACINGRPYCHPEEGRDCYAETSRSLAVELGGYGIPLRFAAGINS